MSMSALCVVIRTPDSEIDDVDVEAGDRLAPSRCVADSACRALGFPRADPTIRAGLPAGSDDALFPIRFPARALRPVRLLCGDHRLTEAESFALGGGGRASRLVDDLIHTVWRTERMSARPEVEPRRSF